MRRIAGLMLMALGACAAPSGQVALTPEGRGSGAISTGPVTVAGGPGGTAAAVRVVDTADTDLVVGTNGAAVSVRPGGLPVRLGVGTGGIRLGF